MKRIYNTILVFFLLLATHCSAKLSDSEVRSLFDQANTSFRAANLETDSTKQSKAYEQTILQFERLVREGNLRNAKLYYNLGNAYLLNENLGKAILNYRRAERLDRSDPDTQKNLNFARSRRLDRVGIKAEQRVRQTLFFWHYDFSPNMRVWLACLGFGGLCCVFTCMVWRGRGSHYTLIAVLSGLLLTANAASLGVEAYTQAQAAFGVITDAEVMARQGDGLNYPTSFKDPLHAGTEFELLEHRSGWYHIRLADDSEGWIQDQTAEII